MGVSPDVVIMTRRELSDFENRAFQRGVQRGKFEASYEYRNGPYARNCANWKNGICDHCGAQSQGCEISPDYKCPHFTARDGGG